MTGHKRLEAVDSMPLLEALAAEQYQEALGVIEKTNGFNREIGESFLGQHHQVRALDHPPLSLEQVQKALNMLTPQQAEIVGMMKCPVLQLIPVTTVYRYNLAFSESNFERNRYILSDINNESVYEAGMASGDPEEPWRNDMLNVIVGWKVAVTEGELAPSSIEGDNLELPLEERHQIVKTKYGEENLIDLRRMFVLMMHSIQKDKFIDDIRSEGGTTTIIDITEGEKSYRFPEKRMARCMATVDETQGAPLWYVRLFGINPDEVEPIARFRLSVETPTIFNIKPSGINSPYF